MNRINRNAMFRGAVMTVSATLATAALAGPVRADHVEQGLGVLLGGIVGGAIGSTIGKGQGRRVAIGVGSALGALYGNEAASHRRHSGTRAHYAHPGYTHAPSVVRYYHQPVPVHVQTVPVYSAPSQAAEISITVSSNGRSSTSRYAPPSITECRLLEDGLAPVYGCRDARGQWRILR